MLFDVVLYGLVFRIQLDPNGSRGHGEDVLHYRVGYLLLQSHAIRVEECKSYLSETATTLFHDMMHWDVEVYVDNMIVKSRDRSNHLAALERFF